MSHRSLICGKCWDSIRLIDPPLCHRCGIPFPSAESQAFPPHFLCGSCRWEEPPFQQARSVGYYEGVLREAIHLFKFGKREEMGRHLGALMIDHFPGDWDESGMDLIVPIPLHPRRRRERGFNQSLILAEALARTFDLRLHGWLLSRARPTLPQSDLSLAEKFANLKGALEVRKPEEVAGKNILLVDDIYTSGATAQEASKALLKAGAEKVFVYTLARSVLH